MDMLRTKLLNLETKVYGKLTDKWISNPKITDEFVRDVRFGVGTETRRHWSEEIGEIK
jgi:hypothetical protein